MKLSTFVYALEFVAIVAASDSGIGKCVSDTEAKHFITKFIGVLGQSDPDAVQTIDEIIAPNFVEYSNSILSLQGLPLGNPGISAPSKEVWTRGIVHSPKTTGMDTLDIIHSCDKIVWAWIFTGVGSHQYPVSGINIFRMTRRMDRLQACDLHLEFDAIAWGLNTGEQLTLRNGTVLPSHH